jgi:hypothetical protein
MGIVKKVNFSGEKAPEEVTGQPGKPMRKEAENKRTRQGKGCLVLLTKDSYVQFLLDKLYKKYILLIEAVMTENFVLDKSIVFDDTYNIYNRHGVKFFITRTTYNQLKIEIDYKIINKFMTKHNISIIGCRHDFLDEKHVIFDLMNINKKYFIYIVSDNALIKKLMEDGIKYYDTQKFQKIMNTKRKLNKFLLVANYLAREIINPLLKGILIVIIIIVVLFIIFLFPLIIKYKATKIILGILILPSIWSLFILRKKRKKLYGFIEIVFSISTLVSIIINPTNYVTSGITDMLKFLSGIYITIRGLDNFEKGIKSPYYLKIWGNVFGGKL